MPLTGTRILGIVAASFCFCDLLQHALPRYKKVGVLNKSPPQIFHRNLPLTSTFLPYCFYHFVIEVHITIEVPLFGSFFDIGMNILPGCVEVAPIRFRVKWKRLICQ